MRRFWPGLVGGGSTLAERSKYCSVRGVSVAGSGSPSNKEGEELGGRLSSWAAMFCSRAPNNGRAIASATATHVARHMPPLSPIRRPTTDNLADPEDFKSDSDFAEPRSICNIRPLTFTNTRKDAHHRPSSGGARRPEAAQAVLQERQEGVAQKCRRLRCARRS